jgi:hypothetical protein
MKNTSSAFEQNTIALIWDFDKTLIPGYMQVPLFNHYGVDANQFWEEVRSLKAYYAKQNIAINNDSIYLNHILTWVKEKKLPGLTNAKLRELGAELEFYPGLPDFFVKSKQFIESQPEFAKYDIKVEHYIVSTGFAEMIRGSAIADHIKSVWGCEFIESPAKPGFLNGEVVSDEEPEISQVASALDNTSKTRALFEINKGVNLHNNIDVNSKIESENRRVPFENMIYVADGPSDVPAFSIMRLFNGRSYAVYSREDKAGFRQVDKLRKDNRIDMFGEADYTVGSGTYLWLTEHLEQIAQGIAKIKSDNIDSSVSAPPRHL